MPRSRSPVRPLDAAATPQPAQDPVAPIVNMFVPRLNGPKNAHRERKHVYARNAS